jgi:cobalt-zinc-cadmium efflux system outer membrane protein
VAPADTRTSTALTPPPAPPDAGKEPGGSDLPPALSGRAGPFVRPPRFAPGTPPAERLERVQEAYPQLTPAGAAEAPAGAPLTLAALQDAARANSPAIRRAAAEVEAAYGPVVQAGLYPNPTAGYQADQWQPGAGPRTNSGQQGAFVSQLFKFPGKLTLAQGVARFDYVSAFVALRRTEVDVATAVRTAYFQVLLARKGVEVNTALVALADEAYRLLLRQAAAGEAAGYEPLLLYAQAVQSRNALALSRATERAAWRQLAAALGRPDLPPAPLAGSVDEPAPPVDEAAARARAAEAHTDVLTARNRVSRAHADLRLQRLNRAPDLETNVVVQHDNVTGLGQFNVQLGVPLPVWDRNQGNIRAAEARVAADTARGGGDRGRTAGPGGRRARPAGGEPRRGRELPRPGAAGARAGVPRGRPAVPGGAGRRGRRAGGVRRGAGRPAGADPGAPGLLDRAHRAVAGGGGPRRATPGGRVVRARPGPI